jgi:hypothetical protein
VQQAVAQVIAEMPAVGKDQRNTAQNFSYRGIDDVLAALKPCMGKAGVVIVPTVEHRETSERATRGGGILFVVTLGIRYRIYGPRGDSLEAFVWGEGTDSGDKATQKAMTGAFKYLLFELFCVAGQAEGDADAHSPEEAVKDWFFENGWRADPKIEGDTPKDAETRAHADLVDRARKLPDEDTKAELKAWLAAEEISLGQALSSDEYRRAIEKVKALTPPPPAPSLDDAQDSPPPPAPPAPPAPAEPPAPDTPPDPDPAPAASEGLLPEPSTSSDGDDHVACPVCLGPTKSIDPRCWACDGAGTVPETSAAPAEQLAEQLASKRDDGGPDSDEHDSHDDGTVCTICASKRTKLVSVAGVLRCQDGSGCKRRAAERQAAAQAQLEAAAGGEA